jgi:hypothetical protein
VLYGVVISFVLLRNKREVFAGPVDHAQFAAEALRIIDAEPTVFIVRGNALRTGSPKLLLPVTRSVAKLKDQPVRDCSSEMMSEFMLMQCSPSKNVG